MRRRSRLRRFLKWVGLVVCVLLLSIWLAGVIVVNVYPPLMGTSQPPGFVWIDRLDLSFLFPLVMVAIPIAFLWHRDRRPPKGHCQKCGYNLTGNVSGVCPECGEQT